MALGLCDALSLAAEGGVPGQPAHRSARGTGADGARQGHRRRGTGRAFGSFSLCLTGCRPCPPLFAALTLWMALGKTCFSHCGRRVPVHDPAREGQTRYCDSQLWLLSGFAGTFLALRCCVRLPSLLHGQLTALRPRPPAGTSPISLLYFESRPGFGFSDDPTYTRGYGSLPFRSQPFYHSTIVSLSCLQNRTEQNTESSACSMTQLTEVPETPTKDTQ